MIGAHYPEEGVGGASPAPRRLRVADAMLAGAWARGWADRPTLDPDRLIGKAIARTGHAAADDAQAAGAGGWRTRLDLLCADLEQEARLTRLGRTIAHGQLVAALANRFRARTLWRRHPDIADQPVPAPIVILGQMRSGTTRVQRLLACDPRLTYTRFYESWNPVPLGTRDAVVDDRKLRGWFALHCARTLNPAFDTIHPTRWNAAAEEIGLHSLSIFGAAFEAQWRVPRFAAAVEQDDAVPVYREFRRLLQTIAWLRKDRTPRPWILKVPQFTQDLSALLQVFPDARLVCLHRDAAQVVASSASLVRNQMELQSDAVDPRWITREWTRKIRLREDRTAAALAQADVARIAVAYDDVTRDWEGEMRRVYAMLGLPLPAEVLAAMRAYTRGAARRGHARHRFDGAAAGLHLPDHAGRVAISA